VGISQPGDTNDPKVAPVVVLAPTRERTVLGVAPAAVPPSPQVSGRELSLQEPPPPEGWDVPEAQAAEVERSIPLDLVPARRSDGPQAAPPASPQLLQEAAPAPRARVPVPVRDPSVLVDLSELNSSSGNEPSLVPAGVPRHRGRRFLLFLAVILVVAAVGYLRREQLRPLWDRLPLKHLLHVD
jgi:hypothetical protein